MKRTICLLLVLCCVLSLCACGATTSTKKNLDTFLYGSEEDVEKIVGTNYDIPYGRSWCRVYKNVDLNGYKGVLAVNYFYERNGKNSVNWTYTKGDEAVDQYEKIIKKFVKMLDGLYGKNKWENNEYVWNTTSGATIILDPRPKGFTISLW